MASRPRFPFPLARTQRPPAVGVLILVANYFGPVARAVLPKAAARAAHRQGWLDFRLGFALLKDRRVSVLAKLAALATGVTFTAILVAIEFPLATLVGLLVPFLGIALDMVVDGLEVIALPLLISALAIRLFAPKAIIESLRS